MAKELYTAHGHVVGGREDGHGTGKESGLEVDIRTPEAVGGPGGGHEPRGALRDRLRRVLRRRSGRGRAPREARARHGRRWTPRVTLQTTEDRAFEIAVRLDVTLEGVDDDKAVELVTAAHQVCPYSRATRGNVEVTLSANGQPAG